MPATATSTGTDKSRTKARSVRDSAAPEIYPDFYHGQSGHGNTLGGDYGNAGDFPRHSSNTSAQQNAVKNLRHAENDSLGGGPDFYSGSGKDDPDNQTSAKGKKKSRLAIIIMIALIGGGGAFLGSSNSLLAPAISALFTENSDTQHASFSFRQNRLIRYSLRNATKTTLTGKLKYTHMSKSFMNRLASKGITVDTDGSEKILRFTYTDIDGVENSRIIRAADFDDAFRNDTEFRNAYSSAKRGRIGTFFDKIADKIYTKLGISRNLMSNAKQTNDPKQDADALEETMSKKLGNNESTFDNAAENKRTGTKQPNPYDKKVEPDEWAEYEKNPTYDWDDNETVSKTNTKSNALDTDAAEVEAKNMIGGIASTVTKAGTAACTLLRVANMVAIMVAANELYDSINYAMPYSENISKMMAGKGDQTTLNAELTNMSITTTNKVSNYGDLKVTGTTTVDTERPADDSKVWIPNIGADKKYQGAGEEVPVIETGYVEENGSFLTANGVQMNLANAPGNVEKISGLYSLERVTSSVGMTIALGGITAQSCSAVKGVSAIVSIGVTIASFGAASIVSTVVSSGISYAVSAGMGIALQFLVPAVATALTSNPYLGAAIGVVAGEFFAKGIFGANSRLGRNGSGQSLSSIAATIQQARANEAIIALDAELDRSNRSPFDITSKNTFLGSIAYSFLPLITTSGVSTLSTLLRTTGTSIASLMGGARAEGEGSSYITTYGNCPTLASIGAVGDIYCNPITTTDMDILDLDPDDDYYQDILTPNFTVNNDGNYEIEEDSNLARYITYCANRDSPFGNVDQNILGAMNSTNATGSFRGVINVVPILGDVFDLIDAAEEPTNMPWATGERCGNTEQNSKFWTEEGRYYQRFMEDTRILEQMGAYEDGGNPVADFMDKYEAEHPLDNTYTGYLSRISGLTKKNVEVALDYIDYYNFLGEYDPSARIATENTHEKSGAEAVAEISRDHLYFRNTSLTPTAEPITLAKRYIIYDTIRNRTLVG